MYTTIRKALDLVGPSQRSRWLLLVVIAVIASGFEMVAAVVIFVIVGLVADPTGEIDVPIVGDVRSVFSDLDQQSLLIGTIAFAAVFFVVRGVVQVGNAYVQRRVAENWGARLSTRLVGGYLSWPYSAHLRRNSSEFIRNGHQAVQELVMEVFVPMIAIGAESILAVGMLIVLVAIAPEATGIAVLVVGGAAVVVLLVIQPRLKRLGITAHSMQRDTLRWFQQSLEGVRDVKVLGRERFFARRYGRSRRRLARARYLRFTMNQVPSTIVESALIGFILVFFSIEVVSGGAAIDALPVLALFAYAGLRLQPSIQKIARGFNNIKYATAPIDDIHADLIKASDPPSDEGLQPLPFRQAIELKGVSYRYEGTDRDAIHGVDLRIAPGEQIGICGPTGGGKSTLVDVIVGLLSPTAGQLEIDGQPLAGHEREWHYNLGLVSQSVSLIDDTMRRNIALGVDDSDIDVQAVDEALEMAQLTEFVDELPDGLETVVGERGVRLSGGQRQRIAIARALYRRPRVLVFDEGTSALDNLTEAQLMDSIQRLRGQHTIILVAHRLSTVRNSDRVVFIDGGLIGGIGTFDLLERENPRFRALAATS